MNASRHTEEGPFRERSVLITLVLGTFLTSMSGSIVQVVVPRIGAWAGVGVLDAQWTLLVALMAICACLLPAGRAGDLFGHVRVYRAGLILSILAALACALAPNYGLFLTFRGLQGVGAAMLMATSPAIVSLIVPVQRRGQGLGLVSTAIYLGLTVAPVLGGWLETLGTFRTVFVVQVPLLTIVAVLSWRYLPALPGNRDARSPDYWGGVLMVVALTGLVLVLARGRAWGGGAWQTWAAAISGLLGLTLFLRQQTRSPNPMLDLRLFRNRTFASAAAGAWLNYAALSHATYLLPFYLLDMLHMSASEAGIYLMSMPIAMASVAGLSGWWSDRVGSRILSSLGNVIMALALLLMAFLVPGRPVIWLVATLLLLGVGVGLFVSPNTSAMLSSAPRQQQGIAAGMLALSRNLGMVVGTALGALMFALGQDWGASEVGASEDFPGFRLACGAGALWALVAARVVLTRPSGKPQDQR